MGNLLTNHIPPLTQWQQWALIYKADGSNEVYLNGTYIVSESHTLNTSSGKLYLGKSPLIDSWPYYFQGGFDDIRIYDRVLSVNEIKSLYSVADPNPPRLVSSSPSNNTTGFSVSDNITVYFDKPLDKNTVNLSNVNWRRSDNNLITGVVSVDNNSLTFDPIDNLSSLDNYTLVLSSGILDLLGNNLSPTQINFQTQMLGSGSSAEPFLISSEEGLRKIHENLSGYTTDQ